MEFFYFISFISLPFSPFPQHTGNEIWNGLYNNLKLITWLISKCDVSLSTFLMMLSWAFLLLMLLMMLFILIMLLLLLLLSLLAKLDGLNSTKAGMLFSISPWNTVTYKIKYINNFSYSPFHNALPLFSVQYFE